MLLDEHRRSADQQHPEPDGRFDSPPPRKARVHLHRRGDGKTGADVDRRTDVSRGVKALQQPHQPVKHTAALKRNPDIDRNRIDDINRQRDSHTGKHQKAEILKACPVPDQIITLRKGQRWKPRKIGNSEPCAERYSLVQRTVQRMLRQNQNLQRRKSGEVEDPIEQKSRFIVLPEPVFCLYHPIPPLSNVTEL